VDLFHRIDDAQAIVRVKGGVQKQVELYRRGSQVFVKVLGGYVRVTVKFGDVWGTTNPGVNVLDMDQGVPGLFVGNDGKQPPRWTGKTTA
jgi:hypothetical protein